MARVLYSDESGTSPPTTPLSSGGERPHHCLAPPGESGVVIAETQLHLSLQTGFGHPVTTLVMLIDG
jgi:hypothetical protein